MTRPKLFFDDPKIVRDYLRKTRDLARAYLSAEERRWHVRLGYNSLTYYCVCALGISRTQTQRLVTAVRRLRHSAADDNSCDNPSDLL